MQRFRRRGYPIVVYPSQNPAAFLKDVIQPVMSLPMTELTIAQPSGPVADNVMYTQPEILEFEELFSNWTGVPPSDSPVGWTPAGIRDATHFISQDPAGQFHIWSSDGASISITRPLIVTIGDTIRIQVEVTDPAAIGNAFQVGLNAAGNAFAPDTLGVHTFRTIARSVTALLVRNGANEARGDNLRYYTEGQLDGEYNNVTVNATTCMGRPAPLFNGSSSYVQMEYARLESTFNPDLGSKGIALYLSSAQWQDTNPYVAMSIGVDSNNRAIIYKNGANTLRFRLFVGGVSTFVEYTVTSADYGKWLYPMVSWSRSNNQVQMVVKGGAPIVTTYPTTGTWSASNLTDITCRIGTASTVQYWPNALAGAFLTTYVVPSAYLTTYNNIARQAGVGAGEAWAA